MLIQLVAPGQPVSGKNHMRPFVKKAGKLGIRKGQAVSDWYERVVPILARQFAATGATTIRVPVHVDVHQFVQHGICSTANPDGDNAQSAAWDALVHARVLQDDRLIVSWGGSKVHDPTNPRVEIEVRVLGRGERP